MSFIKFIFLCGLAFISNFVIAQPNQYLLILSKAEKKMVVLDYQTLDSISSINIGVDPHEIVLTPDQKTAYISNAVIAGTGHIINVIDLTKLKKAKDIDTRPFYVPHGMAWQKDTLWYTAQGSKAIVAYDTKTDNVVQVIGTGQDFTHMLYLSPDGRNLYTTNVESGTISIFENKDLPPYLPPTGKIPPHAKRRTEWRQSLIKVGYGVEGFDVSADGKNLWTALPNGDIVLIDLEKKKIIHRFNTGIQGLHRIKLTPDGNTVCAVSVKTGALVFYNSRTFKLEKKMQIGHGAGIYMDKKLSRMFVACTPDNEVDVIDLASRSIIKKIAIGRPDGIQAAFVQP